MGSYSVLTVGQIALQWKYRVPPFLGFLFEEQDFYSDIPDELDPYEDDERRLGYVTTAASATGRLDDAGFTLPFFAGTYQLLDDEIDAWVLHVVGERLAEERGYPEDTSLIDDLAAKHVRSFPRGTALDDIHKFIHVLGESLDAESYPTFLRLSQARTPGGENVAIDLEELWYDLEQNALRLDPGVLRIGELLSESSLEDYPEVVWLLFLRLLLETTPPDAEVHLDLWSLWDGQDLSNQPAVLAEELSRKVRIYNHVFAVLSENEADIRWRVSRSKTTSRRSPTATARR